MTFTEAAAEVLRLAGRALHYKKITELAIEKNLLSHVGKTPDVTMGSRLATLVKKDRGEAPIIRVKSGYFALREWGEGALESIPDGPDDADDATASVDATDAAQRADTEPGTEPAAPVAAAAHARAPRPHDPRRARSSDAPRGPAPRAPHEGSGRGGRGSQTPPREAGAQPIAAVAPRDETRADGRPDLPPRGPEGTGDRERRGRRRRGRDRDRDRRIDDPTASVAVAAGDGAALATDASDENVEHPASAPPPPVAIVRERRDTELAPAPGADIDGDEDDAMVTPVETRLDAPAPAVEADADGDDDEDEDDDEPILGTPTAGEGRRRRRRRGRGRDRDDDTGERIEAGGADRPDRGERPERADRDRGDRDVPRREDGTELTGRELGDAIVAVLAGGDRSPLGVVRIAELLVRKGRLSGEPTQHHQSVAAVIRADIASHAARSRRHRFRVLPGGRFALTEWAYPGDAIRFEMDATSTADKQRESVYRAFFKRFAELPGPAAVELVSAWLGSMGVHGLRIVRRPGASGAELHLAGTMRRGVEETRLAVVVRRDSREIGRERVIEIRGALQHYGNASAAWLVTTGTVLSGAREEAATPAAPVALFDAIAFGRSLEDAGVGIRRAIVPLAVMDLDLLDTLRGPGDRPN